MLLRKFAYCLSVFLAISITLCAAEDEEVDLDVEVNAQRYVTPVPSETVNFVDPFDQTNAMDNWVVSSAKKDGVDEEISKYNGRWEVTEPLQKLLDGDLGLLLKDKARHNAISAKLSKPYEFTGKPFVMQYEVNFQNGIECGGGYVKLLAETKDLDLENFNDKTPYTIMFGPDKCGESYKLHFIFRHKNPKTGEFEEKHAKQTTSDLKSAYGDKAFHLYTLVINPDNTFLMYLDQKEINRGSLLEDMSPPVNPQKEIEDENDKKPEDWDENERIADPDATKPDDWDEDAPAKILDPNEEMPEGWLEDEPLYVNDPDAEMPEDWDEDMDGEWEAPKVDNPKCGEAPGCGTWEPPMIANPEYKGKWRAPMIANPKYQGIWKPRKIPNPDFFEDLEPYRMTPIGAIGLELWSMSDSIMFDNFIMTDDKAVVDDYAEQTWKLKKIVHAKNELIKREKMLAETKEKVKKEKSRKSKPGMFQGLIDATNERPWLWAIYVAVVGLPLVLIFTFCCSGKKSSESDPKKTDEPTADDPHDSENEENKEEMKEEDEKVEEDVSEEESAATGDAKKVSKSDLEEDEEEEEEEPDKEEETSNRRSPRRRKARIQE